MPLTDSVMRFTARGTVPGAMILNSCHWMIETPVGLTWSDAAADDFAEQMRIRWITQMMVFLSSKYVFQEATTKEITGWSAVPGPGKHPTYGYTAVSAVGLGAVGGNIVEALPYQNAMQVFLATNLGTKRGRGRMKLGPFCENNQADSLFSPLTLTDVLTQTNSFLAPITVGVVPVILKAVVLSQTSMFAGPALGPVRDSARFITAKVCRQVVACQRSRKPRQPV